MTKTFGHEDAGLAKPETLGKIVRTNAISVFLDTNDKRYLVGPKGSGKTLLLLRKAIDQRQRGDAICIPSDPDLPVDRLTAAEHVGRQFHRKVSDPRDSNLAWTAVWKHSIYRSVLHHFRDHILIELEKRVTGTSDSWKFDIEEKRLNNSRQLIEALIHDLGAYPQRPFYYYTETCNKLDSSPKDHLRVLRAENMDLSSLLQTIRMPTFVFLDNLDDYYEREPDLWFDSTYGQFRAIREISLEHRHINLFTSIRQDIYSQFVDEMTLQYRDYVSLLDYTKEQLLEIFQVHIIELDLDLIVEPEILKSNPWRAFFGDCELIANGLVGIDEDIRDYIYRHTLGRPRDLIHMGTTLLDRRPKGGFDTTSVREAVTAASGEIGNQYLAEVTPLLDQRFSIENFVESFLPSDILSRNELDTITDTYIGRLDNEFNVDLPSDLTKPFATLWELGLLGAAQRQPNSKDIIQDFKSPGQGLSNPENRHLPESHEFYLHPVLDHLLPRGRKSDRMVVGPSSSVGLGR